MEVSELSFEEIHEYFLEKGGTVSKRGLLKHFRNYLTHPKSKDDAREKFKKYVMVLSDPKSENGEKYFILRSSYSVRQTPAVYSPVHLPQNTLGIPVSPISVLDLSSTPSPVQRPKEPPPYRPPPPPVTSPSMSPDNISLSSDFTRDEPPQVPPRRRSQEKSLALLESQLANEQQDTVEQVISVKERTQKFNRLASVDNELSPQPLKDKKRQEVGADEDDGAAVSTLQQKRTEWIVAAARADYQALAKLATANPRLVKTKDSFTSYTALHWAAKHGNQNIVKLVAGTYQADSNARSNGGYTPLHIAMQHGHKEVYDLLVDVYGGNPNIRDWSGKTPSQYLTNKTNPVKTDVYLKSKARKKNSDKDLGFLRIGSLNVRVKKTTEAFSNFLGVGSGITISPMDHMLEKVHKSWGSADNVSKDNLDMPAPKLIPVSKRKFKNSLEQHSHSTPGTPNQKRSQPLPHLHQDSDSDTACGFDSNWKN